MLCVCYICDVFFFYDRTDIYICGALKHDFCRICSGSITFIIYLQGHTKEYIYIMICSEKLFAAYSNVATLFQTQWNLCMSLAYTPRCLLGNRMCVSYCSFTVTYQIFWVQYCLWSIIVRSVFSVVASFLNYFFACYILYKLYRSYIGLCNVVYKHYCISVLIA